MTRSIPCEPVSPFTNPTSLSIGVNTSLATTAKYIVRLTATTGSLALTVPAGRSHLIQNEGGYTVNIATTGNLAIPLPPGQELRATWDQAQTKHEIQLAASSGSIDNAMSAVSTNAVQNAVIKAYVDSNAGATVATNLAALRALAATPSPVVVKGHTTAWDGGGGVFDLLASSGGTVGDTGSGGHDDNGWHIVCTATGAVYGRRDTVVTPQQFGAIGVETDAQAAAAADSYAALQRAVTFQLRPDTFPGWTTYRSVRQPLEFLAPHGYYRSETSIAITLDTGGMVDTGQAPGRIEWIGRVWTPRASNIPAFTITADRTVIKPHATFRARKQRAADGKVVWNADNWPDLWRDAAAYPAWAATTVFFAGEEITQVLGSGATALYCVTVGGTSGGSAPTHTSGTAANGSITLEYLGSIKSTAGKSAWELARDCRDIGCHLDSVLEWQTLQIETDGYTVNVAMIPRNTTQSQVGLCKFHGNAYGCKVGLIAASYLYDHLVANQAARLALTGVPIGAVVRQSDDATNDYRFAGPLGGEATNGNWTAHAKNAEDNWCNENQVGESLWYGRGDGSYLSTNKSVYGFVSTKFNTTSSVPSQIDVEKIAVEFAGMTAPSEMVQALIDYGSEHILSSRNDQESTGRALVTVKHADTSKEPFRNVMYVARAGRWISDPTWSKDESCGRQNRVIQTPGRHEFAKEFAVNSLFADAVFSSYNRVYWQRVSIWQHSLTKPQASSLYKYVYGSANYNSFNPVDLSFNFSTHECPCVIVDLPDNHRGDAIIEVEHFQSVISESCRTLFAIFNPITGQVGDFSARPRKPISGNIGLTHQTVSSTLPVLQSELTSMVGQFSPEPWIKRLVVRLCGNNLTGFRVRVLESKNSSVWSPGASYRKMPGPWTAAKPERGIYRAPCRLWYEDQTGVNKGCFLNKGAGETDYYATSGPTGSIGAPVQLQLGHDGAGTVKEWDGSAWQTVVSGVSTLDPADWVNFT